MPTSLQGIANKARRKKQHRFQNLIGMLNEEFLWECWPLLKKNVATGVDHMTAQEYGEHFIPNVRGLIEKLKKGAYRAKLVLRKWIPKGEGKFRPLGIPALEDKLLQIAVASILRAIYEEDFLPCCYGYRPHKSAKDAAKDLWRVIQRGRYGYVVEADIKGFFDNIDHQWMMRMLAHRIDDKPFLRLIKKWLKAGILEKDGKVTHPVTGTPQGGIVSPVLANVYLHYVLDLWFETVIKKQCKGAAYLMRYADDFVCLFQLREDARRFYQLLPQRLAKFNLTLSMEKTRIVRFSRHHVGKGSFDFLGFEYRWGISRKGKKVVKRRTSRSKLRKALANFTTWCREHRSVPLAKLFRELNTKLVGYYNYYGVIGNYDSLMAFFFQAMAILRKWLNRRSQKQSYNWERFKAILKRNRIERPRITEKPKRQLALTFAS